MSSAPLASLTGTEARTSRNFRFKRMLHAVAERLTGENLASIRFLYGKDLPAGSALKQETSASSTSFKDALDTLDQLHKRNKFSEQQVEELKVILIEAKRSDLADEHVNEYLEWLKTENADTCVCIEEETHTVAMAMTCSSAPSSAEGTPKTKPRHSQHQRPSLALGGGFEGPGVQSAAMPSLLKESRSHEDDFPSPTTADSIDPAFLRARSCTVPAFPSSCLPSSTSSPSPSSSLHLHHQNTVPNISESSLTSSANCSPHTHKLGCHDNNGVGAGRHAALDDRPFMSLQPTTTTSSSTATKTMCAQDQSLPTLTKQSSSTDSSSSSASGVAGASSTGLSGPASAAASAGGGGGGGGGGACLAELELSHPAGVTNGRSASSDSQKKEKEAGTGLLSRLKKKFSDEEKIDTLKWTIDRMEFYKHILRHDSKKSYTKKFRVHADPGCRSNPLELSLCLYPYGMFEDEGKYVTMVVQVNEKQKNKLQLSSYTILHMGITVLSDAESGAPIASRQVFKKLESFRLVKLIDHNVLKNSRAKKIHIDITGLLNYDQPPVGKGGSKLNIEDPHQRGGGSPLSDVVVVSDSEEQVTRAIS